MTLERLDHLVLTVRDLDATCDFYRRALGMEVVSFGRDRRALRFGGQKLNLHPVAGEGDLTAARPTPGSADFCLLTAEPLDAWQRRLGDLGVPVIAGPATRTGALGPIESIYLRDPDGNLLEIARQLDPTPDPLEPIRDWLRSLQACVRAGDFEGGRRLCAPDMVAFGTVAHVVHGIDCVVDQQWRRVWPTIRDFTVRAEEARGAVTGGSAWVAAPWDSRGVRPDGTTFARPGRLTIAFVKRGGQWLATHTHFSLAPER